MGRSRKSRNNKGKKEHPSVTKKREMLNRMGVTCNSQENDELYLDLRNNGKDVDFIALIKSCSSKQLTIENTCELINKYFAYYVKKNSVTVDRFNIMLRCYKEVAEAWAYGNGGSLIEQMKLKEFATSKLLGTDILDSYTPDKMMRAMELWHKIYNDEYIDKTIGGNENEGLNVYIDFGDDEDGDNDG